MIGQSHSVTLVTVLQNIKLNKCYMGGGGLLYSLTLACILFFHYYVGLYYVGAYVVLQNSLNYRPSLVVKSTIRGLGISGVVLTFIRPRKNIRFP